MSDRGDEEAEGQRARGGWRQRGRGAWAGRWSRERARAAPPPYRGGGGRDAGIGTGGCSEKGKSTIYLTHLCVSQGRKAVLTFAGSARTAGRRWRRNSGGECGNQDDAGRVRRRVVRNTVEEQKMRDEPRRPPSWMTSGGRRAVDGDAQQQETVRAK